MLKEAGEHRDLRLNLGGFAWEAIRDQAAEEGMTVEEIISFSVLYYLADCDSGRIARCAAGSPLSRSAVARLLGAVAAATPRGRRRD